MKNDSCIGYIYAIKNLVNEKVYIGQTININERWSQHKSELNKGKHTNKYLQQDWTYYGKDNFKFEVIHTLQFNNKEALIDGLNEIELIYISTLNLCNKRYGYNIAKGGGNYIRHDGCNSAKPVAQYTIKGKYIRTWDCMSSAGRYLGNRDAIVCISNCCKGRQRTAYNYRWAFLNEDRSIPVLEPLKPINKHKGPKLNRPVAMYSLNGEVMKKFNTIIEASEYLNKKQGQCRIVKCCQHKIRLAYGYKWEYIRGANLG